LKSLRMQQAGILLTTTFLSVKEIARRVGLTDESHFVRDFKRIYGVTPSEYRNDALLTSEALHKKGAQPAKRGNISPRSGRPA